MRPDNQSENHKLFNYSNDNIRKQLQIQLIGILNSLEKWTKYSYIEQKQSSSHKKSDQLDIRVNILNFNVKNGRGKNYQISKDTLMK